MVWVPKTLSGQIMSIKVLNISNHGDFLTLSLKTNLRAKATLAYDPQKSPIR